MCEEGDGRDHRTDTHSVAALLKTRWERVENKAKILTMVEQKGGDVNEQMNYRTRPDYLRTLVTWNNTQQISLFEIIISFIFTKRNLV